MFGYLEGLFLCLEAADPDKVMAEHAYSMLLAGHYTQAQVGVGTIWNIVSLSTKGLKTIMIIIGISNLTSGKLAVVGLQAGHSICQ